MSGECVKRALLVGLNYKGTDSELSGCENDLNNMKGFLEKQGYSIDIIRDEQIIEGVILSSLKSMLKDAKKGDKYVFYYSGHGSYVHDVDGDEKDGKDESLCEGDYYVTDDQINKVLCSVPEGVKIIMIIDACHSGTMADLQYRFSFGKCSEIESENKISADIVMLSGCEDDDVSHESHDYQTGKTYGALSTEIIDVLRKGNYVNYSWTVFSGIVSGRLDGKQFTQKPQLSASKLDLMMERVAF